MEFEPLHGPFTRIFLLHLRESLQSSPPVPIPGTDGPVGKGGTKKGVGRDTGVTKVVGHRTLSSRVKGDNQSTGRR